MFYGIIIIIWSILTVELTLYFNTIEGVDVLGTTGQLIPFIIGLIGKHRQPHT